MCARCTVCPSEAPERLGLKVFRARGCRGEKIAASRMVEDHGLSPERSEPNVYGSGCWRSATLCVL